MTEEVVTQEQVDADVSLRAGYDRARGTPPAAEAKAIVPEAPTSVPEPAVTTADDEWDLVKARKTIQEQSELIARLDHRLKGEEGRTGAALRGLHEIRLAQEAAAKAAPKVDAPTEAQIEEAAQSKEGWESLENEFPKWAKGINARISSEIEDRVSKIAIPDIGTLKQDLTGSTTEAIEAATRRNQAAIRETLRVDIKFPTWEEDVYVEGDRTKGFSPDYVSWINAQAPGIQALANSDRSGDAIKLLDAFYKHRTAAVEAAGKESKNKQRLASAVMPQVASGGGPTVLPDEAGLSVGYNRMKRA